MNWCVIDWNYVRKLLSIHCTINEKLSNRSTTTTTMTQSAQVQPTNDCNPVDSPEMHHNQVVDDISVRALSLRRRCDEDVPNGGQEQHFGVQNRQQVYTINRDPLAATEVTSNCNGIDILPKKKKYKGAVIQDDDGKMEKSFCKSFFSPCNIRLLLAEFIGTGLLLFLGCMGCITDYEKMPVPHYMPAVSFGLTVMIIIQMFGHISGAHLNPAVTMVTAIFGIIEKKSVPFYLLGQFAGAIFGLGGLKLLVPEDYVAQDYFDVESNSTKRRLGLCTNNIHPDISAGQGLIIEIVITFVLIFVCCAIWDERNETKQDSVPLRFGFVIAAIAIAAGPFSGGSMNTARSFAPALLNGDWENQWIYWVGPTIGALIACYSYKFVYALPKSEKEDEYKEVVMKEINEAKV